MGVNPKGRDWGWLVNWDDLGKVYAAFIIFWTILLYSGAIWLLVNRRLPYLRIRNVPLAITSTSFLHIYLIKIVLAYTTNGHFLCSAEFWIMSIYLPFGIALFQANLAQLRSISDQQKRLISQRHSVIGHAHQKSRKGGQSVWEQWKDLPHLQKTYVYIGIGMAVQLIITAILYATSPVLQGDWTSYGPIRYAKGQALCRKSEQWVPSAFWQLAWSWLYGPYTLWSVRKINDVHYWRLEVFLSVLAGLPGSPLWLIALYTSAFKSFNKFWVPPMWLAPGIVMMQFVTIFFPIYESYVNKKHNRAMLKNDPSWDGSQRSSSDATLVQSSGSYYTADGKQGQFSTARSRRSKDLYTMAAMEKALSTNPVPLLRFAATRDFTAENILFLTQVRRWHAACNSALATHPDGVLPDDLLTQLYQMALEIYLASVHDGTTDFPINIESNIRQTLDVVFGSSVPENRLVQSEAVDPFNDPSLSGTPPRSRRVSDAGQTSSHGSEDTVIPLSPMNPWDVILDDKKKAHVTVRPVTADGLSMVGDEEKRLTSPMTNFPDGFDCDIFDAAEKSIKYLVLTNTWQKFVRSSAYGDENFV